MNCPEHKILNIGTLWVWLYWHDFPRRNIPLRVWLNPLRYEVSIVLFRRRFVWNREGIYAKRRDWKRQPFLGE